jgi:hypothetical protein
MQCKVYKKRAYTPRRLCTIWSAEAGRSSRSIGTRQLGTIGMSGMRTVVTIDI